MRQSTRLIWIILFLLGISSCRKKSSTAQVATRPFHQAFTPFPYEVSFAAVEYTYAKIATDADMICHSFDEGIPWQQSLGNSAFSSFVMNDWNYRKQHTPAGHKIFVQSAPLSFYRDGLAPVRDTANNQPLPPAWSSLPLNHVNVKTAYLNYCKRMIDFFRPDYFNFGLETNMLVTQNPSRWNEYLDLHQYIYTNLKSSYPSLLIFSSIQGSYILDGQIASVDYSAQHQALTALLPYEDIFAISIYPYATDIGTAGIPQDLFDKLKTFSAGKPMAIAETGYIAQSLSLTSPVAFFPSDAVKQNNYISFILQQAEMYRFLFVNNFILRDYDKLWQQSGGIADISALWRDTGLYDENGNERPALSTWKEWLKKTYAR